MMELIERKQAKPENSKGSQPRYALLAEALRLQILNRELKAGERLPSFAEFRVQHGVTLTTTEKVYSLLEQEGLIERRHGVGTFVAQPKQSLTGNIGYIGSAISHERLNPFRALLIAGVHREIDEQERHLLYLGTGRNLRAEAIEKVDGVIICHIEDTPSIIRQLPAELPRVSLLNIAEDTINVVADDVGGGRRAVEELLKLGHRRIACLMERLPSLARRRLTGYYDAMLGAGIEPDSCWVRLTDTVPRAVGLQQPYVEWGRHEMRSWIASNWKELGCTAIVVQNEQAAIGVLQVLQEMGIQVPQQVSVIGFDGTEMCEMMIPRLSTIQLPLADIGAKGVEILTHLIEGEAPQSQTIVLPVHLHEGDSLAPPCL